MLIASMATAGGGYGRLATVRVVPPVSTQTAAATSTAAVSTTVVLPSAPLCGSVCTLKSSIIKSSLLQEVWYGSFFCRTGGYA